jgi:hypothetical protein
LENGEGRMSRAKEFKWIDRVHKNHAWKVHYSNIIAKTIECTLVEFLTPHDTKFVLL